MRDLIGQSEFDFLFHMWKGSMHRSRELLHGAGRREFPWQCT